jgi:hypothetical protein
MRIAQYRRVSTEEQRDSGAGMEAQRIAIEAEVERRGWTIVARFEDTASGRDMRRRAGLARAIEAVESDEADALVVSKLDRLTRSVVDLGKPRAATERARARRGAHARARHPAPRCFAQNPNLVPSPTERVRTMNRTPMSDDGARGAAIVAIMFVLAFTQGVLLLAVPCALLLIATVLTLL